MKRIALLVVAAALAFGAAAQNRDSVGTKYEIPPILPTPPSEKELEEKLQLLDSTAFAHWGPAFDQPSELDVKPVVTMSSLVVIPQGSLPKQVHVMPNNVLRLGRAVTLSTGNAAQWSPWPWAPYPSPGAYLDARTLSMPLPR